MTVTYCTADNVASLLRLVDSAGVRFDPDGASDPTQSEIEGWINEAEDYIDEHTHHAWRSTVVTNETHDYHMRWDGFGDIEHAVTLRNRAVLTFSHTTDKIELWNGSAWKDILDPANGCTEARDKDYWVDYQLGIIYLVAQRPLMGRGMVRVTYRYGETVVPGDIKRAAELFVGIQYLQSDFYRRGLPDGSDFSSQRASVMQRWSDQLDKIIDHRVEFKGALVV